MLTELMYTSCAHTEFTDADLNTLLLQSRERNLKENITGVLLYDGRVFMQILEGHQPNLDNLLESIKADGRHYNLVVHSYATVRRRTFSGWALKCIRSPITGAEPCAGEKNF